MNSFSTRVRRGVAAQPELLDELFALFVRLQFFEGGALFIGDDVGDILVQPLAVRRLQLFLEPGFALLALFFGEGLGDRLALLVLAGGLLVGISLLIGREEGDDDETWIRKGSKGV